MLPDTQSPDSQSHGTQTHGTQTAGDVDGWARVLDELERTVRDPDSSSVPWAPPADIGPIPEPQRGRAERLLAALQRRHADVAAKAGAVQTELRLIAAAGPGTDPAVYLDLRC